MTNQLRLIRCSVAALAIAAGTLGATGTAAAVPQLPHRAPSIGSYPVHTGTLQVTGSTTGLLPGSSLTVSGGGYMPGSSIQLSLYSEKHVLGTETADPSGSFTGAYGLPTDLCQGSHTVEAVGPAPDGGTLIETVTITIASSWDEHPYPGEHPGTGEHPYPDPDHHGKHLAHTGADPAVATAALAHDDGINEAALAVAALSTAGLAGGLSLRRKALRRTRTSAESR